MKRCAFALALILGLCITLCAGAEKRGETVVITFTITDNSQNAISARVGMEFNSKVFEFIGAEVISADVLNTAPRTEKGQFGLLSMKGISTGDIGRITLRIKNDAPSGRYEVNPVVDSGYNAQRQPVTLTVTGGRVSVDHMWDNGRVMVEATCYTEGVMSYTCVYCKEKRTETIQVTQHQEGSPVVMNMAKCTENGLQIYPCKICHDTLREEVIPAFGHTEGERVVTLEPTCSTAGALAVQCATCGRTVRLETILATGKHTEVIDKAIAATCTTPGKTEGKHCSVCNVVISAQTTIPTKSHSWNSGVVTCKPTITAEGVLTYTCTVCQATRTERIPIRVPGDANSDGRINISDALLVFEYGSAGIASINLYNTDVNQSGGVDLQDALLILQYCAGWNVSLQ